MQHRRDREARRQSGPSDSLEEVPNCARAVNAFNYRNRPIPCVTNSCSRGPEAICTLTEVSGNQ